MYIVNQYGQLYNRVSKNSTYDWELIDNIPRLKPNARSSTRFLITEEGDIFDAEFREIVPYSSHPNRSMKFVDCIIMNTVFSLLLSEDGILLSFNYVRYSNDGGSIRRHSEVIDNNVEAIGMDIMDDLYYIKDNAIVILNNNATIPIESPIIGYWNGYVITKEGIGMVNASDQSFIVYMPLLGQWDLEDSNYQLLGFGSMAISEHRSDTTDPLEVEAVIFERVKGKIVIRRIVVGGGDYDTVIGEITKIDSHIINSIDEFSPFVGCTLINDNPYIYTIRGLTISVFNQGEVMRDQNIPDDVFKTRVNNKNARKL
jgi:hypothetical protein